MATNYIPQADSLFNNWITNLAAYINTNFALLGLTSAQNTALQAQFTSWTTDYPAAISGQTTSASHTQTPYTNTFNDVDAGKTVHYMLRWVNTRNEPGPWSETISVTISG